VYVPGFFLLRILVADIIMLNNQISLSRDLLIAVKNNVINANFKGSRKIVKQIHMLNRYIFKGKVPRRSGWQVKLKQISPEKMTIPTLFSSNVRSIVNKFDNLQLMLHTKLHANNCAILLQETWLNSAMESALFTPLNYVSFRQDRCDGHKRKGGGVAIFINKSWCRCVNTQFSYSKNGIDCISVTCKRKFLSHCEGISITNVYIPPTTSQAFISEFYDELSSALIQILGSHLCVIAGDFNKANTSTLTSLGFSDLVTYPTRDNAQLDHIFCNEKSIFKTRKHAPIGASDHCVIRLLPKVYGRVNHKQYIGCKQNRIKWRNTSPNNRQNLRDMLLLTDFSIFEDPSIDVHVDVFTEYLKFCYDICCPSEYLLVSPNRINSPYLKQLRRKKERAYKCSKKAELKRLNAMIDAEISRLNSRLTDEMFSSDNPSDIWRNLKLLTGNVKVRSSITRSLDDLNESFVYSPAIQTQGLTIPILERSNVPPVVYTEVLNILRRLKCTSSCGPDGLSSALLKYSAAELAEPVMEIINKSLSMGIIPISWKTSKVIPIPKPCSSPSTLVKYRPIACTSVLLKVVEHYVLKKLSPSLEAISDPNQFAYKKKRSTLDAVACLQHLITSSLDQGCVNFKCIFLDFSSAFNTICRQSILDKLLVLGTPGSFVNWIYDYFRGCMQYVFANSKSSASIPNDHGVLQGAVLSPALFSMLTDSLVSSNVNTILKYADDTVIAGRMSSNIDADPFSQSIKEISKWSNQNSLLLNKSKCNECIFHFQRTMRISQTASPSSIDGCSLECVEEVKYLGVHFSSNCTWSTHVSEIFSKCLRLSFSVKRLRSLHTPFRIIEKFVFSCIVPLILYCSPVIFPGLLKKDITQLRRAIKLISRSSGIHMSTLFGKISDLHFNACSKFAEQIMNDSTHPLFPHLFPSISFSSTRSSHKPIFSRTSTFSRSTVPFLSRLLSNKAREVENFSAAFL
jgi:hypothetical protein